MPITPIYSTPKTKVAVMGADSFMSATGQIREKLQTLVSKVDNHFGVDPDGVGDDHEDPIWSIVFFLDEALEKAQLLERLG